MTEPTRFVVRVGVPDDPDAQQDSFAIVAPSWGDAHMIGTRLAADRHPSPFATVLAIEAACAATAPSTDAVVRWDALLAHVSAECDAIERLADAGHGPATPTPNPAPWVTLRTFVAIAKRLDPLTAATHDATVAPFATAVDADGRDPQRERAIDLVAERFRVALRAALTAEEAQAVDDAARTLGPGAHCAELLGIDVDAILAAAFRGALDRPPTDETDRALEVAALRRAYARGIAS